MLQAFALLEAALKSSDTTRDVTQTEKRIQELFTVAQLALWALLGRTMTVAPIDRVKLQHAVNRELVKYSKLQRALIDVAIDEDQAGYEVAAEVLALVVAAVKRAHPEKPQQTMETLSEIFAYAMRAKDRFDRVRVPNKPNFLA